VERPRRSRPSRAAAPAPFPAPSGSAAAAAWVAELVAAGADAEVLLLAAADANHLCSRRKPLTRHHGGDGGGEAAGSEERARRKQVGRRVQRCAAVRAWFAPSSAPSSAASGSGRRGVARGTGLRDVSLVWSRRTTLEMGASSSLWHDARRLAGGHSDALADELAEGASSTSPGRAARAQAGRRLFRTGRAAAKT
jgi:hypothetical protein